MRLRAIAAGLALFGMPGPSSALTFALATKPGDTLTTAQSTAFAAAASAWSAVFTDNITINLQIGFASLGDGILGQTVPAFLTGTAASVDALLAADAKDANDAAAVASLSTQTASMVSVSRAQGKALGWTGLASSANDGTIEFSTNYAFSTQRNADGSTPAGTYDLIGIAEHEIGHILGFDSQIDGGPPAPTLLDQFRFSAPGARSLTAGISAYFSIDNGATNAANFSIGGTGNYQASHWLQGTGSLMDPAVASGVSKNITALDIAALDVIGFDVAVPEPGTAALLLVGLTALAWSRRRPLRIRLRRRTNTPSRHRRRRGHTGPR